MQNKESKTELHRKNYLLTIETNKKTSKKGRKVEKKD